jgi:hypothetical protein
MTVENKSATVRRGTWDVCLRSGDPQIWKSYEKTPDRHMQLYASHDHQILNSVIRSGNYTRQGPVTSKGRQVVYT